MTLNSNFIRLQLYIVSLVNQMMFDKQGLISYINGISLEIPET